VQDISEGYKSIIFWEKIAPRRKRARKCVGLEG